MRKKKRINNWQAEDDEKINSIDIKQRTEMFCEEPVALCHEALFW